MRKLILAIQFLCLTISGYSQSFQNFFADTTKSNNVFFRGYYDYGSSAINNQLMNKFIIGGRIEDELKNNTYKKLKPHNTFGGDVNFSLNAEIAFDTLFGKNNLSLLVGVETVDHVDVKFTDDLFQLAFDGNKQFAGKYAELGGSNFNYFSYQQANFGLLSYKKQGRHISKEGIIISVIKAQEHIAVSVPKGKMFTEQLGKEIELDIDYVYNNSDTNKTGFWAFNGYGVSTDLFSEFYLKNEGKITVQVNDLGFIQWNKKSIQIQADSIFNYDGVDFDNIFDLNDSIVSDISRDSILNLISSKRSNEGYAIALPTTFNVFYTKQFTQKIKYEVGLKYKILANYFPLVYGNLYYSFNSDFVIQAHVSYGGYGRFNLGSILAKSFKNKFQAYLGTNNLMTFILPQYSYSSSGFVGLKMYF